MFARAKQLNTIALRLVQLAIVAFLIAGTLASLPALHASPLMADVLHYLPFALISLSIPCSLMCGFLLYRLGISAGKTLVLIYAAASLLFLCGSYFGMAAWLGIPWVLKWSIEGFERFLATQPPRPADPNPPLTPTP
jgi:hypothetical protein